MARKQITALLPNKIGSLAKVAKTLAAAKVNIEGISMVENTDSGMARMIVSNVGAAKTALNKAGIAYTIQDVEVVALKDAPGSLAAAAGKLARAKVSIHYFYGTACNCACGKKCDCQCLFVISASDLKKAKALLG
ncbi:amino acid-binding protein [Candidatus Riflebacteria bacterium]